MPRPKQPTPDPYEAGILADIADHGWSGVIIEPDAHRPGFEYTVGLLATFGHPEVIICGLPFKVSHDMLWAIVRGIREGQKFSAAGDYDHVLEAHRCRCQFVAESRHAEYLGYAMWHHRISRMDSPFAAVQCLWPDEAGRFAGERDCDLGVASLQPDLSRAL